MSTRPSQVPLKKFATVQRLLGVWLYLLRSMMVHQTGWILAYQQLLSPPDFNPADYASVRLFAITTATLILDNDKNTQLLLVLQKTLAIITYMC